MIFHCLGFLKVFPSLSVLPWAMGCSPAQTAGNLRLCACGRHWPRDKNNFWKLEPGNETLVACYASPLKASFAGDSPLNHLDKPCSFNPLEKIRIFPPTIFDCQEQGSIDKINYEIYESTMNQVSSTYISTNKFLAKKTCAFCWIRSCG